MLRQMAIGLLHVQLAFLKLACITGRTKEMISASKLALKGLKGTKKGYFPEMEEFAAFLQQ